VTEETIDLKGTRVLVVDDDPDNCDMLATVLEHSGAHVYRAESAAEALTTYERERPDVVTSDIGLPDEDGFALLRKIRTLPRVGGSYVPAIALTGYGNPEDYLKAGDFAFEAHLTKPVELGVMLKTLARVLQSRAED
jgi:CheY-like chemotaxis protein